MIARRRADQGRVEDAIHDLAELRSLDPAALPAVHAIALTRLTLESFWLDPPALTAATSPGTTSPVVTDR